MITLTVENKKISIVSPPAQTVTLRVSPSVVYQNGDASFKSGTTSQMNQDSGDFVGQNFFNTDENIMYYWSGTAWKNGQFSKKLSFTLNSGVVTYNLRAGWTANPTVSDNGSGTISINSTAEFSLDTMIAINNLDCNWEYISSSLIRIYYNSYTTLKVNVIIE